MHPWPGFNSWLNATEAEIRDRYARSGIRPDRLILGTSVRYQIEGDSQFWATARLLSYSGEAILEHTLGLVVVIDTRRPDVTEVR